MKAFAIVKEYQTVLGFPFPAKTLLLAFDEETAKTIIGNSTDKIVAVDLEIAEKKEESKP